MAKQTFDWWSLSFLLAPLLELLCYLSWGTEFGTPMVSLMLFLAIGSFVLLLWMCLSHSYKFTQTELVFRAGPFRRTLSFDDIFEVMPTHDGVPKSRGAVRIRYYMTGIAGDSSMMFPRNQSEFFAEMASRCPQLEAFGGGLKRATSTTTVG
jgi:hypothetical protein